MSETYCGKSCEACSYAPQLNCPGCKTGQYSPVAAQCSIASCCRSKGHERCETCGFQSTCPTLRNRERVPGQMVERQAMLQRKLEAEAQARARALQSAGFLGKWLNLLFWLVVPGELGGLLSRLDGPMRWAGVILTVFSSLAYGLILLKMADESDDYRTAGICVLVAAPVSLAVSLFFPEGAPGWTLLLTLPAAAVQLAATYLEFQGHSQVSELADHTLSEKWSKLWKYHLYAIGAMFGGLLLIMIAPILGLLAVLGGLIAYAVLSILKLVYLYQTARSLRDFSTQACAD